MVSIIIPCYNVADYLWDCLVSVQNQTYPFIEVVLVDDGSNDETPSICDRFAKEYTNTKVFHICNGGVSNARNLALKESSGEYIAFIDADDMIAPDYIKRLVNAICAERFDLVYCKERHFRDSDSIQLNPGDNNYSINSIAHVYDFDYCGSLTHSTVWGCLFHRKVLEGLEFRTDIFIAEDSLFFNSALLKSIKIGCLDAQLYYYRIRHDSATGNAPYSDKKMTEIIAWEEIVKQNDNIYPNTQISRSAHYCLGSNAIKGIKLMYVNGGFQKEKMNQLISIIRRERTCIKSTGISYKKRLRYQLFSFFPHICGWLYKLLKRFATLRYKREIH